MAYHEGELAVQSRAGVRQLADRVGRIIGNAVPPAAADFLRQRPFVIASTVDAHGDVNASLLAGPPGFAIATSPVSVSLEPSGGHLDAVFADLNANETIGLLAIDPATRRRMRINGRAAVRGRAIDIATREVYSNCPQYIQERHTLPTFGVLSDAPRTVLDASDRAFVGAADTFFIASAHPQAGADASHRGGGAGFVRVESPTRLSFPDYSGNNMFNTLGNVMIHPRVGLLFVDFKTGGALRIRGDAEIVWGHERRIVVTLG